MLRYAMSDGFRRKGIAFAAVLGAGLGTALMTVLLSLSGGMDREVTDAMNAVAGTVTVTAADAPLVGGVLGGGSPLSAAVAGDIAEVPHVESVQAAVVTIIPPESLATLSPIGTPLRGIDPETDSRLGGPTARIVEGRAFAAPDEVIVGRRLAVPSPTEGVEPVEIGQEIEVPLRPVSEGVPPGTAPVPPVAPPGETPAVGDGLAEMPTRTLTVVGIFETGNQLDDFNVVGAMETVRELAGLDEDDVTSFTVLADSAEHVEGITTAVEDLFASSETDIQVTVASDILGQVNDTLDIVRGFLTVVSIAAAVAGGMSIFVIMLMSVTERTREFGILKAAGWSNGNLLTAVIVESVVLALAGALVGLGVGYGAALAVDNWLAEDLTDLTPGLVGGILAFGAAMGVLGGMYPATRAARVSPIRSLRAT